MSDLQILQVVGCIYILVGLGGIFDKDLLKKVLEDFSKNFGVTYLGGLIAIFMGFIILSYYHTWSFSISGFIMFLGVAAFIKGVMLLLLPKWFMRMTSKIAKMKRLLSVFPYFCTLTGILLLYISFFR